MMELGTRRVELLGYFGNTYPVSESRFEAISKILAEEAKQMEQYKGKEVPRKVIGSIRRKKMESLVQFDVHVPDSVYESKDFPLSLLADIEAFFLINARIV